MKNLSKHIEYLLLTHDCVIIPQLGAFVARRVEGRFSPEENLFLPPYRTVHFNPQIRHSDGLLENSLIEHYNVSLQEAKNMCSEFVDYVNMMLVENGTMDFGTIGVFSQDEVGIISFMPCLAGVTTPMLYGLDSFQMEKLQDIPREKKKKRILSAEEDSKHITIRINKLAAKYVAAVAASIILFLCLSTPIGNTSITTEQNAAGKELFMPSNLWPDVQARPLVETSTSTEEEGVLNVETIPSEEPVAKQAESSELSENIHPVPVSGGYAIVFASAVSVRNAENYASNLQSRGIQAVVQSNGKLTRVVLPGFQTSEEARIRVNELKALDSEFASVWILNLSK